MTAPLSTLERVPLRDAWKGEAADFTPWLASEPGLKLLGDTLGMELVRVEEERPVGPFRADILAKRSDVPEEHWVLVENQLEKTDHAHLGQLLTYGAGLKAATIVWVAETFTDEHRAALDWLNDITAEAFEFYGVEIELWRIGGSAPAPKFNLVARPNDWTKAAQDTKAQDGAVSPLKQQQCRYWAALRALLLQKKGLVKPQKARPQHWAPFSIGRSGAWLSASINSKEKLIAVELALRGPPGKVWFHEIAAQKQAVELAIGAALSWEDLPGKIMSRVALYRHDTDATNEGTWPEQHAWLADTLETFAKVFRPRVKALSGVSEPEDDDVDAEAPVAADEVSAA
jgi:hypothetical protein